MTTRLYRTEDTGVRDVFISFCEGGGGGGQKLIPNPESVQEVADNEVSLPAIPFDPVFWHNFTQILLVYITFQNFVFIIFFFGGGGGWRWPLRGKERGTAPNHVPHTRAPVNMNIIVRSSVESQKGAINN